MKELRLKDKEKAVLRAQDLRSQFRLLTGNKSTIPEHWVYPEKCLVFVKFGKTVTLDRIQAYAKALRDNPLFKPTFSEIVDLTAAEEMSIDADKAVKLADSIDPFALSSKRAFVARSPGQINAARMQQLLRNEKSIVIVDSVEAALRWIES